MIGGLDYQNTIWITLMSHVALWSLAIDPEIEVQWTLALKDPEGKGNLPIRDIDLSFDIICLVILIFTIKEFYSIGKIWTAP